MRLDGKLLLGASVVIVGAVVLYRVVVVLATMSLAVFSWIPVVVATLVNVLIVVASVAASVAVIGLGLQLVIGTLKQLADKIQGLQQAIRVATGNQPAKVLPIVFAAVVQIAIATLSDSGVCVEGSTRSRCQ
jgi:hypothetical protein